jgi:hypothetical protein
VIPHFSLACAKMHYQNAAQWIVDGIGL